MRFVDAWLGRFVDRLRSTHLYEKALVIVTADHGISYEPGTPRRDFSAAAAGQIMRVPLIVKFPVSMVPSIPTARVGGQNVSDRNAQTIDILPTVADVLNVAIPWRVDGVSLADAALAEPQKKIMFFDAARKTMTFDRAGPDISGALMRKLAAFDECGDRESCGPQPDRFGALVGRPVRELRVSAGGGRVEVDYLARFENFDAASDETPFDLGGRFDTARAKRGVTYVAVAVNGVVQAVTRTWDSNPSGWLATPDVSAWRQGRNEVQVFVIEGDERAPALRQCDLRAGAP
jgi:sulfatase-like protein